MRLEQDSEALWAARFIDRDFYTTEEIFRDEQAKIFSRIWHFACFTADLKDAGDFFTVSIAGQPIILLRGGDGRIRAFHNACSHRGATLTDERSGNAGPALKCLYHAWMFDLKGTLIGVPYARAYGPDFDRGQHGLVPVRCEAFHDIVFVCLDAEAPTLIEYLGEMAEHLAPYVTDVEPIGRNSWVYRGNWKLWNENARDNYHPEFAHRAFHDAIPHYADRGGNWALAPGHSKLRWIAEAWNSTRYMHSLTRYSGVDFTEEEYASMRGADYQEHPQEVLAIFPNMDVQPGQLLQNNSNSYGEERGPKRGYIQIVTPLTVGTARVDFIAYSWKYDTPEDRQKVLDTMSAGQGPWGKVACDDTEAANRCQLGLNSAGRRISPASRGLAPGSGGFTPQVDARDEYSMREFYRVYQAYLGIGPAEAMGRLSPAAPADGMK